MIFNENHKVPCPQAAIKACSALVNDWDLLHNSAKENRLDYWAHLAQTKLDWHTPFQTILDWKPPHAKWFLEGTLNASVQCLDANIAKGIGDKTALVWRGEPTDTDENGERRTFTYSELHSAVCDFSSGLLNIGIEAGDRVIIYLPLVPEALIAMLACARIGAVHSVVFAGFSSESLKDRSLNCGAKCIITADFGFRRSKRIELLKSVESIRTQLPEDLKVVVLQRENFEWTVLNSRANFLPNHISLEINYFKSEHPLFLLYTSGTTGKPKGLMHTTAGYMLWAKTSFEWVFGQEKNDIFWCTADVGWITGHTYLTYGPLSNGATVFLYEGAPDYPDFGRFWRMIEKEKITILYTAPTAIRAFMKQSEVWIDNADLSSLRLLGSVGEPINPEAWQWYFDKIGGGHCPVVDTWWQTETGGVVMCPTPQREQMKPGCAMSAMPGFEVDIVDASGTSVSLGEQGNLVIKSPWPSQARTVFGDPDRYVQTYWSQFHELNNPQKPWYFTGDGAYRDKNGHIWIIGRIDDVLNVAGHRIGTMEIESAMGEHDLVAESAVVGVPDPIKGTAIYAYVLVKNCSLEKVSAKTAQETFFTELRALAALQIGSFAKPDHIKIMDALPKTRSGKIMRRLLRDLASGNTILGDVSTLEDISVLSSLQKYQED